ncbi:hypothetical protein [Acinetobacter indicus]|uniref:hypothetical protein n=1 Tax=Acinetobacter indicus TaxID=756892 RepID=UPI00131514B9|nr:hypothetical protein [Acinetobacter indicus]
MGIKYCKACKKPMQATDTHCRTCGTEYKNSPAIIVVAAVLVLALGLVIYFLSSKTESTAADEPAPVMAASSNWIYDSKSDPISGTLTSSATVQASDFDTKTKVDAEFTMVCSSGAEAITVGITATYPMKTDSFSSDGPMARYYMKIDQNEPLSGTARAAGNNMILVLSHSQSKTIIDQLKPDSKVIFQMSSVKDTLMTYEADLNGAIGAIEKVKQGCTPKPPATV